MNLFEVICVGLMIAGTWMVARAVEHWHHARRKHFVPGNDNYPNRNRLFRFGCPREEYFQVEGYSDMRIGETIFIVDKVGKKINAKTVETLLEENPHLKKLEWRDDRMSLDKSMPGPVSVVLSEEDSK